MELIDIYRAFHAKAVEYTFFSSADGTFSRIDHMLGQKVSFCKFEKIEIISSIFYEIRNQLQGRKNIRNTNVWRLNNMLNQWNPEEIKEEIKKYLDTNEMKDDPKSMGYNKSSSKKDVYNNKILLHEIRKIPSKQPNLGPKATRERRPNKIQS